MQLKVSDIKQEDGALGLSPLAVIGQLISLESLSLKLLASETAEQGLSCLTQLTKLQALSGFEHADVAAVDAFWAALRCQR